MAKGNSTTRARVDAYGEGCRDGHIRAGEWLANPKRGRSAAGGTLQYVFLDIAERMAKAAGKVEIDRIRGEIVGFCYAIECPQSAAELQEMRAAKH